MRRTAFLRTMAAAAVLVGLFAASAAAAVVLDGTSGANTTDQTLSTDGGLTLSLGFFAEYLIVAGGGGAGASSGGGSGGGGAGGLLTNVGGDPLRLHSLDYTIEVGKGGAGADGDNIHQYRGNRGESGGNSSAFGLTAIGGGGGGSTHTGSSGSRDGGSGGSGGGGAGANISQNTSQGGSGTSGQGYRGGDGRADSNARHGGGGGGAGAAGQNGQSSRGGKGGDGLEIDITGTLTYYAGGGGGGSRDQGPGGAGGLGGGGAGTNSGPGGNALPNTGGGGGGGEQRQHGGDGGSGVVIVRYQGAPAATTGDISQSNGYTVHRFKDPDQSYTFDLVDFNERLGMTITSSITGDGDLTFTGPGTLTLAAENTYTGDTRVKAGTLELAHAQALGSGRIELEGGGLRHSASAEISNEVHLVPVVNITDGLAAAWRFDGDVLDSSGNNRDGTIHGAAWTEDRFGRENNALWFDGEDDHVTTTLPDTFTDEFTISAWVQRTAGESRAHQRLLGFDRFGKGIDVDGSGLIFAEVYIGDRINTERTEQTELLPLDEWVHLAMVVSRPDDWMGFYADGVLVEERDLPAGDLRTFGNFLMGNDPGRDDMEMEKSIDDVRVFNRALSLEELGQLAGWSSTAPIDVAGGVDVTYTGAIVGMGGLEKLGGGTLELTGTNTYTGDTRVSAGTLHVTGSLLHNGSAHVEVASAGDAFGAGDPTIVRRVGPGGSFAGLGSRIAGLGTLGTTADLLAGENAGVDALDVAMAWRTGSAAETAAFPPLTDLLSDVLQLTGMDGGGGGPTDPFVLEMTYDPTLVQPYHDPIFLAWLDDTEWVNAVHGNDGFGSSAVANYAGSWTDFTGQRGSDLSALLGSWGVDTTHHAAWAVLNHNSEFAVLAIPEPTAWLLLLSALACGLLVRRRR